MTPGERQDPMIINGSRRARIARGSGVEVGAVKNLVERFFEARKMMSKVAQGGMPGMPGMPGMGGGPGRQRKKQKAAKGKQRSGNPMKRRQQEQQAVERRQQAQGSAFGLPGDQQSGQDFELPDEFKKFMD
jgi:signal recognition particle subunit SRP54